MDSRQQGLQGPGVGKRARRPQGEIHGESRGSSESVSTHSGNNAACCLNAEPFRQPTGAERRGSSRPWEGVPPAEGSLFSGASQQFGGLLKKSFSILGRELGSQ